MHKYNVIFLFFMLFVVSCTNREIRINYETKQLIDLSGNSNEFDIIDRFDGLDVINLSIDDNWKYLDYPMMVVSKNGYYFLSDKTYNLISYDTSGNIKYSRQIKGRGRGEVLNVGNIFERNDTLMIYDLYYGRILCFDPEGTFCSFMNRGEFLADKLYPSNNVFLGLSISGYGESEKNYCASFDSEGTILNYHLPLPQYLNGLHHISGHTPLSYLFHDTLRFMVNFDYNIFSLTEKGLESSYCFHSSNQIPEDLFDGEKRTELKLVDFMSKIMSEGYTSLFEGLFETDKYIVVNYRTNGQRYMLLYDKGTNTFGRLESPKSLFDKSMIEELTTKDIWSYIMFSFTRLYSDDETIYGRIPYSVYTILSASESLFDEKISAFYKQLKNYVLSNNLSEGESIFIKMKL